MIRVFNARNLPMASACRGRAPVGGIPQSLDIHRLSKSLGDSRAREKLGSLDALNSARVKKYVELWGKVVSELHGLGRYMAG